jgi:hypothetical protein
VGGDAAVSGTFTCQHCGRTFPKGWSDEDAEREYDRVFPGVDEAGVEVCDDCYLLITAWLGKQR